MVRNSGTSRPGYLSSNEFSGIDADAIDGGITDKLLTGPMPTLRVDTGIGYSHESRTSSALVHSSPSRSTMRAIDASRTRSS